MNGRAIPRAYLFTFRLTKISANECDPGTNYLRLPRYHCTAEGSVVAYCVTLPLVLTKGEETRRKGRCLEWNSNPRPAE